LIAQCLSNLTHYLRIHADGIASDNSDLGIIPGKDQGMDKEIINIPFFDYSIAYNDVSRYQGKRSIGT